MGSAPPSKGSANLGFRLIGTRGRIVLGASLCLLLGAALAAQMLLADVRASQPAAALQGQTADPMIPPAVEVQQPVGGPMVSPPVEPTATLMPTAEPTATSYPTAEPTATLEPTPTPPVFPIAVMVENHFDARPQSGLAKADIVYEALVEGGISRFMAIYVKGEAEVIGPVRSARHYFVYLAAEYNAPLVHIGSSPQGYGALIATSLVNLDETYGDPGFWRSRNRWAPHNAYSATDMIRTALDKYRRVEPGCLAGFKFAEVPQMAQGPEAPEIGLVYPGGYSVKYVYLPDEKQYRRYMEGYSHRDADSDEQVAPRNLVVQYVDAWLIPGDDAGRLDMEQLGEGKALFFRDGVVTEGRWLKPSYGNHTEWYDLEWNPIVMNPGKLWVQMIPPTGKVTY